MLELQKRIDHQKFQIQSLTEETELFMQTCEEQKRELAAFNIEMMRQEFDEQIQDLLVEKEKISELILNLTEEYKMVELGEEENIKLIKQENMQIAKRIEEHLNSKEADLLAIADCDQQHKAN